MKNEYVYVVDTTRHSPLFLDRKNVFRVEQKILSQKRQNDEQLGPQPKRSRHSVSNVPNKTVMNLKSESKVSPFNPSPNKSEDSKCKSEQEGFQFKKPCQPVSNKESANEQNHSEVSSFEAPPNETNDRHESSRYNKFKCERSSESVKTQPLFYTTSSRSQPVNSSTSSRSHSSISSKPVVNSSAASNESNGQVEVNSAMTAVKCFPLERSNELQSQSKLSSEAWLKAVSNIPEHPQFIRSTRPSKIIPPKKAEEDQSKTQENGGVVRIDVPENYTTVKKVKQRVAHCQKPTTTATNQIEYFHEEPDISVVVLTEEVWDSNFGPSAESESGGSSMSMSTTLVDSGIAFPARNFKKPRSKKKMQEKREKHAAKRLKRLYLRTEAQTPLIHNNPLKLVFKKTIVNGKEQYIVKH